ncbi:hypothetical protein EX895_003306 [Sporisorium graminicola]|uniref:VPS9 domain-containing protein n=1 Tax=Sporisorium graminicola TaxID=280036 RepID=A0A4U7KT09_9BASI|nr:hypothetical protein EX895_003306 [Sporisorium graminicola]TKY87725.1 hypothetical protein EX895_003306 [Sporisorium graminicola]
MQRSPIDSLDPDVNSSRAGERPSQMTSSTTSSSDSTSPRFPITRLEATDRAEWLSKTVGRNSDVRPSSEQRSQPAESPSSSTPSTPTTATPSSRTYHSLNYAPRQRNSMLRPSAASVFQAHSSQFSQGQPQASTNGATSLSGRISPAQPSPNMLSPNTRIASHSSPLTATSYVTTSPSYPTISLPDAPPPRNSSQTSATGASEADTARAAMARIQLQQMQDEARRLGLTEKSAGWLILEALQAATEGEWAAVAELLANGDATLLLPRDPPSVFTSASQLSASFAYDHTIFNASSTSAIRPTPSVVPESLPILTLSGLRGSLSRASPHGKGSDSESFELTLQTFVVKTSQSSISNLKDAGSRQETLETLAPLPNVTTPDDPKCRYPTFSLWASNAQFPLPPPLNARTTSTGHQVTGRNRSRSNSKLNAAGSRASASFASIFGGSGRERRRHATTESAGSEMLDAQRLSANAVHLDSASSRAARPPQTETDGSAQDSSSLGAEVPDDANEESNEDSASAQDSSKVSASFADSSRRTVSVWVVDHLVRRSAVMRTIRKTLDTRIKKRLATANITESISEVVASFSATYLPPVPSLSDVSSSRSGVDMNRSRASSPVNIANPPYLADPDDMSDNFQDFFNSIRDQLYKLESTDERQSQQKDNTAEANSALPASASLEARRDQHDLIERQLEMVESVLCEEVYDRIFCPATSRDRYHDDALASRIAALNVLGLSLRHLGLDVPSERLPGGNKEVEQSNALFDGLDRIVQQCGAELQRLESASCRSPHAKLAVLVRAHKIAVEGTAELPNIKMRDDDADADDQERETAPTATKKTADSTSADLILPILIYSIVSSNPSRLASNLLYIERFRAESLVQGETSYCLVNVQAAVAFLENVDVKDLGLDSSQIGAHLRVTGADGEHVSRASRQSAYDKVAATATLAMPARIRGRLTQEIGDLAGASNKVITGVMGSSISAFSRMMGASANGPGAGGVGDPSTAESTGRKRTKSTASINIAVPRGGAGAVNVHASPAGATARPLRSRTSSSGTPSSVTPTDYSRWEEPGKEKDMSETPTSGVADKPSIGDRLAMLGRLGASALSSSPSSSLGLGLPSAMTTDVAASSAVSVSAQSSIASPRTVSRELPGPPPPSKAASAGRTTSYLAAQLGRITTAARSASSTSLAASAIEDLPSAAATASKPLPASLQSPFAPLSRPPTAERPLHVVVASTGSVASVKIPLIVEELLSYSNVRVQVIATDASLHFYDKSIIKGLNETHPDAGSVVDGGEYTVASLAAENLAASRSPTAPPASLPRAHLWVNADEWTSFTRIGDPILHIELRRWADIVLVAPASANTLAKLNAGLCDDLLTSFLRALSPTTPTVLFPAMNTLMYMHPLTEVHLKTCMEVLGYEVRGPVEKTLACGDTGRGAMCEWTDVVGLAVDRFGLVREAEAEAGEGKRKEESKDGV